MPPKRSTSGVVKAPEISGKVIGEQGKKVPSAQHRLRVEDLSPYLSLRILSIEGAGKDWTPALLALTQGIEPLLTKVFSAEELTRITTIAGKFLPCGSERSSAFIEPTEPDLIDRLGRERTGWLAGCVLSVHVKPSWLRRASDVNLENTTHHLLTIAVLPPFVAVSSTREGLGAELVALLEDDSALGETFSQPMTSIPTDFLDKTFVRGEAFNIWLDGLHRPTVFKADKQTMTGPDLRRALDPIGHRTFAYSSVRSRLQAQLPAKTTQAAVGYSKATATVWLGTTTDSHDYMRQFSVLCDLISQTITKAGVGKPILSRDEESSRFGLRHLSQEIDPDRLAEAKDPFEVELDLGEPGEGQPVDSDRSAAIEAWRTHGQFRLAPAPAGQQAPGGNPNELAIRTQALWDGQAFREFKLVVHPGMDRKLHVTTEGMTDYPHPDGESFVEAFDTFDALDFALGPRAFMVRFDSGHVLNRERLYLPVPPDVPFEDWRWVSLSPSLYDVTKEKPEKWTVFRSARNFKSVDSGDDLFSFVVNNIAMFDTLAAVHDWYLLCHDQPQEVADFVLIAPAERMLSHIHVKGAETKERSRRVAIGAYDLVVTQAIKNLPRLDVQTLLAALRRDSITDREAGQFVVYRNGGTVTKSMDCTAFIEALQQMSARPLLSKNVVIFQPHVRAGFWLQKVEEWRTANVPSEVKGIQPVFMLSSLLMDAKIACMRIGASFSVWGELDIAADALPAQQGSPFLHGSHPSAASAASSSLRPVTSI